MYGKPLVPTTIGSNIMFNTYLCARVRKGSKNISLERMYLEISKGIARELWYSKGTGRETIKCKPRRIISVTKIKEKVQVVLVFLIFRTK